MEDCVFCKIVKGEVPCSKIWEDEKHLAFLDAFPTTIGQVLIIPKRHIDYFFNLNESEYSGLLIFSKKIAKAIDASIKPIKTGLVVEGLEVPHVHVKLFPLTKRGLKACLDPLEPKPSEQEMSKIANKIAKEITS